MPVNPPVSAEPPQLLSIGEMSRASGLSVSALRFYDAQDLLRPAAVDPATGYRRYSPDQVHRARLVAGMRRVSLPVAEMAAVLDALGDPAEAVDLLDGHEQRLERSLEAARRELDRLRGMLRSAVEEAPGAQSWRLPLAALGEALAQVRYAASADPQLPVLRGVLLARDASAVRVAATDRYRLATATVPGTAGGPATSLVLPLTLVDDLLDRGPAGVAADDQRGSEVELTTSDGEVRLAVLGTAWAARAAAVEGEFPDVARLLDAVAPQGPALSAADLTQTLQSAPEDDLVRLGGAVSVNRQFLWDAVSHCPEGTMVLPGGGEIGPLALLDEDDALVGLLMPVRADPVDGEREAAR